MEINNSKGDLSAQYPSSLLIPESDISTHTIYEHTIDAKKLRALCKEAKSARCRTRFPIPVIIFRGKYICRSSTLSGSPEAFGRAGIEKVGNFFGNLINGKPPPEAVEQTEEDLSKLFSFIASKFSFKIFFLFVFQIQNLRLINLLSWILSSTATPSIRYAVMISIWSNT